MCQTTVQIKAHDSVSCSGSFCLPPVVNAGFGPVFPFPPLHLVLPANTASVHRLPTGERGGGAWPGPRPPMTSAPYRSSRQTQLHISTAIWPCSDFHAQPTDACVCVGAAVNTAELQQDQTGVFHRISAEIPDRIISPLL